MPEKSDHKTTKNSAARTTSTQVVLQRKGAKKSTTKKLAKKPAKSAKKDRDANGRFIKGYKPKTTFADRPNDRYDISKDSSLNPQHSPRLQLRKLWSLPKDEVKKRIMTAETATDISYGEYLALLQANRARRSSKDFESTMNQAEGAPMQPIDMEVEEKPRSPYNELSAAELRKLIGDTDE